MPDERTNSGITLSVNFVFKRFNQVIDDARVAENGPFSRAWSAGLQAFAAHVSIVSARFSMTYRPSILLRAYCSVSAMSREQIARCSRANALILVGPACS
jgi:hypothetical protein